VVHDCATTEPEELTVRHCPAEPERLVIANAVVVAFVVVAFAAVKFCNVEEPVTSKLESVARLFTVSDPLRRVEPVLETEKSVVVAVPVDDAMLKRLRLVSPTLAKIESLVFG